jgi:hypothetical protein
MPKTQDRSAINRMLGSHGLGQLEEGAGLMAQLGFLVQDHEHLRSLLARCEPESRSAMFDSLKSYLKFQAKPLDAYIAESAMRAEAQKLPVVAGDGTYKWPQAAASDAEIAALQASTRDLFEGCSVVLTCMKCTREAKFEGLTKMDAIVNARMDGWSYWVYDAEIRAICPECPAIRKPVTASA